MTSRSDWDGSARASPAALERVLITDALDVRPVRSPDPVAETHSLQRLATSLSECPVLALNTLADEALTLLGLEGRGSAGISILEEDPECAGECRFRRAALSGRMSYRRGGVSPRGASPCGVCLDFGRPVLFSRPEQTFREDFHPETPIVEGLTLPFHVRGCPVGVVWAVTHDEGRLFDAEDVRIMTGFAAFAGAVRAAMTGLEEAEEAKRAKNDFLAMISHDLRTPLNAIGGYAALLEMGISGALNTTQAEHIRGILTNHMQLTSLVDKLLTLSIIDNEGDVAADVALDALLEEVRESFLPLLQARGMSLNVVPATASTGAADGGSLHARVAKNKMNQILQNLVANAVDFTERGGSIALATRCVDGALHVDVSDTGVGIPREELENIFEPFVRLRTGTRDRPGSGLGLAISRRLARSMGGDITVESTPGRGAVFTVSVPAGV